MKLRITLLLSSFLSFCIAGNAQVTLENFSAVVNPGFTGFYGTFSSTGNEILPSDTPSAGITQGSGFFSFTGANTTNDDNSILEIYFQAPVDLTGLGFLALTAESLALNASPSLRIVLFSTNGNSASAVFTATQFPTGGFTTAIQALNIGSGFAANAVELVTISGDTFNGTSRFNFSFDNLAAVSAIPEPSTYAAIFGALALGFVAYRRRQKAA